MSPDKFAFLVGVAVFASGAVGLILQRVLPEKFTTGGPRDMIGAVVGLLTLLSALVLGLLIWTAYGVYASQNLAVQTIAAKVVQLDLALADYGPEAAPLRARLQQNLAKTIDEVWGANENDATFIAKNFSAAVASLRNRDKTLAELQPSTDAQKQALASAVAAVTAIGQSRLQMSFALSSPVSYPLMLTVVAWAAFLFVGYGLMSKGSPMSIACGAVGAIAVASAVFLILDLSNPYSGVFRTSPAPLEQVLAIMGKESGSR
jgi:Protein of unknown function (DUF4239)